MELIFRYSNAQNKLTLEGCGAVVLYGGERKSLPFFFFQLSANDRILRVCRLFFSSPLLSPVVVGVFFFSCGPTFGAGLHAIFLLLRFFLFYFLILLHNMRILITRETMRASTRLAFFFFKYVVTLPCNRASPPHPACRLT